MQIECFRFAQELIPYGATILQLFQQTLKWTSTISENQMTFSGNKPFRNVRISTYKCLCSWLMNTSSSSGIETIANECVVDILKDITPNRDCILLSVSFVNYRLNDAYIIHLIIIKFPKWFHYYCNYNFYEKRL